MCMTVFVAADHPLPLRPWHKDHPDFHVIAVADNEKWVKGVFSVPHARYAGTYEGCGCAFNVGREYPESEYEQPELVAGDESRKKLYEYITSNRVQEMFVNYEENAARSVASRRKIVAEDILNKDFVFSEGELLSIQGTPNQAL